MKKTIISLLAVLMLSGCCSWCIPDKASEEATKNALLSDAFVTMMEQGKTSRDEEQSFIKSSRRAWHAQNFALNDVPLPPDIAKWYEENAPKDDE
jgi:hypothetical protein